VIGPAGETIAVLRGPEAGAALGYGVAGAGDLDGDGADDLVVGAPLDGDDAGAVYLVYGPVDGTRAVDDVGVRIEGLVSDTCGYRTAGGRDVTGDGRDDAIFGCGGDDAEGADAGAAYVVATAPTSDATTETSALHRLAGERAGDKASAVDLAEDVDGDGTDDVLVGAATVSRAYVVHGPVAGDADLGWADTTLEQDDGAFGWAVQGVGDTDGDGYGDVVVGSKSVADGASFCSLLFVYAGTSAGVDAGSERVLAGVSGSIASEEGYALDGVGDFDGDGRADFVLGAPYVDTAASNDGAVYLVRGPVTGDAGVADFPRVQGDGAEDYLGLTAAGGGDVDGDGWDDLVLGAPGADGGGTDAGAAYVLFGGGL
jgi:hypothetical protein